MNGTCRSDPERRQFEKELLELLPFTRAFARTLTGNTEEANDLAQEALARAWAARKTFIAGTNLKAWLFTILRNQFYSDKRRAWRQTSWDEKAAERIPSVWGLPTGAEARHDLNRTLQCMTYLSDEQRDSLVAVGYLGMSYEEAADKVGCAVGTVKSRVARARHALDLLIEDPDANWQVDVRPFQTATKHTPKSHPFYPVAVAYEELFAEFEGAPDRRSHREKKRSVFKSRDEMLSKIDRLFVDLVASGALSEEPETLNDLMRLNPDDF